jgi:cytochrome c
VREMSRAFCSFLVPVLILFTYASETNANPYRGGRSLAQQWCAQCHGVPPNELSADSNAPSFSAVAREPSATEYALRVFLRTPHPTMPNFVLNPDGIDDLVSYIVSLRPN